MNKREKKITFLLLSLSFLLSALYANEQKARADTISAAPAIARASQTASVIESVSASTAETFPVVRVTDGDTIVIQKDGEEVRVRLIGLNTPETVDPRKPVECFGKEASAKAQELLTGKTVRIETDPSQSLYDKYGRLLAYVFLPDGTNISEVMIGQGYGYEYTYNTPYKYQNVFKTAELSAKTKKIGLWAPGACGH